MFHDTSPRFHWRRPPRHLPPPEQPVPPTLGRLTYSPYGQAAEPLPQPDAGDEIGVGPLFQVFHSPASCDIDRAK